jgi:hypothetical protein
MDSFARALSMSCALRADVMEFAPSASRRASSIVSKRVSRGRR